MKLLFSILRFSFIAAVFLTGIGAVVGAGIFFVFSRTVPDMITLDDYKPAVVTQILGRNDEVVGEFFEQRRYVTSIDNIPDHVVKAFVVAEDDRFFTHQGVDFLGMLRAAVVNIKAGHVVQGGSTITQQVAKSILLTPERSFTRKIKEIILASRMEKNFSKKQILFIYLNQIYFGEGAYGVEAASRVYFNKHANELTIGETAILAGLPQAPSRYSPLNNPKKAKERQIYVLRRLAENGIISTAQEEQARNETIKVYRPRPLNESIAPYYVEHVRQQLLEKYGKEELYNGGLTVKTTLDPALSRTATKAVQAGLRDLDRRHGYRGVIRQSHSPLELGEALDDVREHNLALRFPYKVITPQGTFAAQKLGSDYDLLPTDQPESLIEISGQSPLFKALVQTVDDQKKEVEIDLSLVKGFIPFETIKWAMPARKDGGLVNETVSRPSQVFKRGDVVWVSVARDAQGKTLKANKQGQFAFRLEQKPLVQGALVSIDHLTGEILALVGGYSFAESEFNRALQAERQPGSSYKPIIYSAAIDRGYTPATVIQDSPLVFTSGDNQKWKPLNHDENFLGDITFRLSLIKSLNIPTIKIVQDLSISYLIEYSKRLGWTRPINSDFSIALGSVSTTLFDLVKIYSIFPRSGRKLKPIFIRQVIDRMGHILEDTPLNPPPAPIGVLPPFNQRPVTVCGQLTAWAKADPEKYRQPHWEPDATDPERVMDPRTAYVMTHLMNEVTTMGTGSEVRNLGRTAAGKTGTTNDYMDALFLGFTPQVTTGVWVGFDVQRSLGHRGTGAQSALPIWLEYMRDAVKGYPDIPFSVPPGISYTYINGTTGRVVAPGTPGAIREVFIEGTEPGKAAPPGGAQSSGGSQEESSREDFLKEDFQ